MTAKSHFKQFKKKKKGLIIIINKTIYTDRTFKNIVHFLYWIHIIIIINISSLMVCNYSENSKYQINIDKKKKL